MKKWIVGFCIVVLSVVLGGCSEPSDLDAQVMAELYVEDNLLSPLSAEFSGVVDTEVTNDGDGYWTVEGYVDAENLLGVMIRNYYYVELYTEDGENWELVDLYFEE